MSNYNTPIIYLYHYFKKNQWVNKNKLIKANIEKNNVDKTKNECYNLRRFYKNYT